VSAASAMGQQLYQIPDNVVTRWSSFENRDARKGSGGKENMGAKGHAFDVIPAHGKTAILDIKGAGVINRIWLTVNERSPIMLRAVRLEMYWEAAKEPAVSAPLGDFFGVGLGRKIPFESELFSDPEGRSFNCYIPMPFETSGRILIVNDSDKPVTLFYDIDLTMIESHTSKVYYFHCYWSRENKTKLGRDYTVLPDVSGKGRFLGMNVGVIADTIYGSSWWGEGEVKIFLDGDGEFATLVGTGTEDYIGTAWGQGAYAHRFQGCPIADEKNKQWCFYRYHIPDPVYFSTRCKVTLQQIGGEGTAFVRQLALKGACVQPISVAGEKFHKLLEMNPVPDIRKPDFPEGWTNYYREDDVSATAYFYLDRPVNGLPVIAPVEERVKGLADK
ncbi:MAG TPA: glycoside hydrolase family 172 protein, partial [Chryseosolibacter sp.]|nr:glycoside hydrolase family 172 protein [Chryseosolibacter sp.]